MCIIYTFGIFFKLYDSIAIYLRVYLIKTSETSAFLTVLLIGMFHYLKKPTENLTTKVLNLISACLAEILTAEVVCTVLITQYGIKYCNCLTY